MARQNRTLAQAQEQRQDKLRAALDTLEAGIAAIIDGASFARYLRVMARFRTYSVQNALLIQAQRPDATRVAGYRAWQALGRQVRKGEQGITILVPLGTRVLSEDETKQPAREARNADGAIYV